jgi:hypothetical protein
MKKNFFTNIFPLSFVKKNYIFLFSFCLYKNDDNKNLYFRVNNINFKINFLFKKGLKLFFTKQVINLYSVKFDFETIKSFPIQNKIEVINLNNNETCNLIYNIIYFKKFVGAKSKLNILNKYNTTFFIRQGGSNTTYLTIRKINQTDFLKNRILIFLAFVYSKITLPKKYILFYEKEANRYEESASILYEKMIDMNYKNCYFLISRDSFQNNLIKGKYKKNIVFSHTFKHYYMFFKTKNFIGTEAIQHAAELRTPSRLLMAKIALGNYRYVFLQHGVMYMVSLNSSSRSSFRKGKGIPKKSKIVVSSQKEADHFIKYGNFSMEDLYLSGLPKFDKSYLLDNADKIIIMPTWRPWEYNMINNDFYNSGYYKMIYSIFSNIPKKLKEKVIILPHPLILEPIKKTDLNKYIPVDINYDTILRSCSLLITDYSSVSYDSFYRGSNVIFWWKDKNYCMDKYEGELMLKEEEAFGDICYDEKDLKSLVLKNYMKKQDPKNIEKYRTIVQFYDNKNTERLVEMLRKDNFI